MDARLAFKADDRVSPSGRPMLGFALLREKSVAGQIEVSGCSAAAVGQSEEAWADKATVTDTADCQARPPLLRWRSAP